MFIKKQDYLNFGISQEILNFVEEDLDGFLRHNPKQTIGDDGDTLFSEVAKILKKPEKVGDELSKIPNPEVESWFFKKENKSHIWKPKKTQ